MPRARAGKKGKVDAMCCGAVRDREKERLTTECIHTNNIRNS